MVILITNALVKVEPFFNMEMQVIWHTRMQTSKILIYTNICTIALHEFQVRCNQSSFRTVWERTGWTFSKKYQYSEWNFLWNVKLRCYTLFTSSSVKGPMQKL